MIKCEQKTSRKKKKKRKEEKKKLLVFFSFLFCFCFLIPFDPVCFFNAIAFFVVRKNLFLSAQSKKLNTTPKQFHFSNHSTYTCTASALPEQKTFKQNKMQRAINIAGRKRQMKVCGEGLSE
jgi:hypothetical protein